MGERLSIFWAIFCLLGRHRRAGPVKRQGASAPAPVRNHHEMHLLRRTIPGRVADQFLAGGHNIGQEATKMTGGKYPCTWQKQTAMAVAVAGAQEE
jgi:hypothetical protein